MIFIETENLYLKVPSRDNLAQWTQWINSPFVRETVHSTLLPKTIEMQWEWVKNELSSEKRIILEICDKVDNSFIGITSLSNINHKARSAQIAAISPFKKNKKSQYIIYEARIAILNYAFKQLSLNKVYADTVYPNNKSYMIKNMCIGFEIEGINHDSIWYDNQPKLLINYFLTKLIFDKKKIINYKLDNLLSKKNRNLNEKKLSKIISYLQVI